MNGRDLALGLMAGLALAGAVRKRGSANTERKILVLDPSLLTVVREQVQEGSRNELPPEEILEAYSYGKCFWLALALHERHGWPLVAEVETDRADGARWISHAWVEMPDGREFDIYGPQRRVDRFGGVERRVSPKEAFAIIRETSPLSPKEIRAYVKEANEILDRYFPALGGVQEGSAARTVHRTNPALWEAVKAEVTASDKGGRPGQWSARKAQRSVQLYKERGGDYLGPKDPDNALARWTKQDWRTHSGAESLKTGERYLPAAAFDLLTLAEVGATTRAKRAGMRKGKQFVPQPANIARKTKKAREGAANTPFDAAGFTEAFRHWYTEHDWERESDEERAFRRWARAHGATYLGAGAQRIVFSVPGGALKVAFDRDGEQANRTETEVWEDAPEQIRRHLVPVLEGEVEGGAPWILMEEVRATGKGRMSEATRHALNACGIQDLTTQNLADDGRLLDYGWIYRDDWKRCSTGRGYVSGSPNVIAPSGFDRTAMARPGPSVPARHLQDHASHLLVGRVLDFGSGQGADATYLRATPYDPHHPKAAVRAIPTRPFDTVLCTYVLNVLPPTERAAALRAAANLVKPGGHLLLAVRPKAEVDASTSGWTKCADGAVLRGEDGTRERFQRGYTGDSLQAEVKKVLGDAFTPVPLSSPSGTVMLALRRSR